VASAHGPATSSADSAASTNPSYDDFVALGDDGVKISPLNTRLDGNSYISESKF